MSDNPGDWEPWAERPLTLTEFLLARIAEDEKSPSPRVIAEFREVARRQAGPRASTGDAEADALVAELARAGLSLMAAAFSDHPDYDEAWRP